MIISSTDLIVWNLNKSMPSSRVFRAADLFLFPPIFLGQLAMGFFSDHLVMQTHKHNT